MDKRYLDYIPRDDIRLFNEGKAADSWKSFGCVYIPELNEHRFTVWAPKAKRVSLAGDFNAWQLDRDIMERVDGGFWVSFLPGLQDGMHYKFCIDGCDAKRVLKADPFAAQGQYGSESASVIRQNGHFEWTDSVYLEKRALREPVCSPMSVYEVHLGSWRDYDPSLPVYRACADMLCKYCTDMAYTHVELLPITEYPYDGSWGYQVTGYFAPTSRYGSPDDFKYLVNKLHEAGIGIIIDWVPAHFPKDEHGLAAFDGGPLFERKERRMAEHPEWGTLIFDYASPCVQSFLISSACKLFEHFHVDGIRVDAVSSMLYLSYARPAGQFTPNKDGGEIDLDAVDFLRRLNATVLNTYPGAITIAEESSAYPLVTGAASEGGLGFTFKWDMGYMHDTLDYMQCDTYFRSWQHDKLTFSMLYCFSESFVLAYSHDEVVHLKKPMIEKMFGDYDLKFASLRVLYSMQYAHPGKKHNFMGNEFGQFTEWNRQGPLDWFLLSFPRHKQLQSYVKELNRLYISSPALFDADRSWDGFKWLNVDDRDRCSVAFMRMDSKKEQQLVCALNFSPLRHDNFVIALPCPGTVKEFLSSDEERFGGSGIKNDVVFSENVQFLDMPCSARLTLPPMAAVWLSFEPDKASIGGESTDEKGI